MKKIISILLMTVSVVLLAGCKDLDDNSNYSGMIEKGQDYEPEEEEPILKDEVGWETTELSEGLTWFNYENHFSPFNANQIVNVLALDLSNPNYRIEVAFESPSDALSNVAVKRGAIAGINGTYELDASFIKTDGTINSQVTIPSGHLRFWKHEGAFFYNGANTAEIRYGTNASYAESGMPDIISGAPMLINNYVSVGETFIGDVSGIDLNSLEYEDYRRHQGVRHPRTAVALTADNHLLLITIDGRWDKAAGMSAKEVTQFLNKYFGPQYALNLDGGGSTTMYVKDGGTANGVVNYPNDNETFDHNGEREVSSFILIRKTSDEAAFAGGSGTASDPYIITKVAHMNNMHTKVDWSKATTTPVHFRMDADVDMSGINWTPVNNVDPYAKHMHFDGNGHIIKNLTSKEHAYAGFAGVVCGSVRNLGILNAVAESAGSTGIIGGYVGLKGPNAATGIVENCFTSGTVSGNDAVGGIAGNIGKEDTRVSPTAYSAVLNCYSTATVKATNTTGNARAGGIVGIIWNNGIIENCYSAGAISTTQKGVGGVASYSDMDMTGCVALNASLTNTNSGKIGRIAAFMGAGSRDQSEPAQGVNCLALSGIPLDNGGTLKPDNELVTGTVATAQTPYDGATKTAEELLDIATYTGIGWKTSGTDQIWAGQLNAKGYPILQWQFIRGDYDTMSGHSGSIGGPAGPKPSNPNGEMDDMDNWNEW